MCKHEIKEETQLRAYLICSGSILTTYYNELKENIKTRIPGKHCDPGRITPDLMKYEQANCGQHLNIIYRYGNFKTQVGTSAITKTNALS